MDNKCILYDEQGEGAMSINCYRHEHKNHQFIIVFNWFSLIWIGWNSYPLEGMNDEKKEKKGKKD